MALLSYDLLSVKEGKIGQALKCKFTGGVGSPPLFHVDLWRRAAAPAVMNGASERSQTTRGWKPRVHDAL